MASRIAHRKHRHLLRKKHPDSLDYMAYIFGVAAPLFELPQAWQIYTHRDAKNVSLTTWAFSCIDNLIWIAYAWCKKEWALLLTSILFEVIDVAIVVGVLKYS